MNATSYNCSCSEKNHGKFCQFENACLNETCQNNGTCLKIENSFKCNCSVSFLGEKCEVENPCYLENPCHNNGTCQPLDETSDKYQCLCVDGYSGKHCQTKEETNLLSNSGIIKIVIVASVVLILIVCLVAFVYTRRRRIAERRRSSRARLLFVRSSLSW